MVHYFDEQLNQPINGGLSIGVYPSPLFNERYMCGKLREHMHLTQQLFVLFFHYLHGQTSLLNLTEEQIPALATDEASKKSGEDLAHCGKWISKGAGFQALWRQLTGTDS